jgi:hypothetical protein
MTLANVAFSCPATIEDEQHVKRPEGSQAIRISRGPRMLNGMSVFIGNPSKRVQIQPDSWSKKGIYTWDFARGQDVWVECTYRDSAAVITYNVGATRQCSYTKSNGGLQPNVGRCAP